MMLLLFSSNNQHIKEGSQRSIAQTHCTLWSTLEHIRELCLCHTFDGLVREPECVRA